MLLTVYSRTDTVAEKNTKIQDIKIQNTKGHHSMHATHCLQSHGYRSRKNSKIQNTEDHHNECYSLFTVARRP